MLTPNYYKKIPKEIVQHIDAMEEKMIRSIVRNIKKTGEIKTAEEGHVTSLIRMGHSLKELEDIIEKETELGNETIKKILRTTAVKAYENDRRLYMRGGKHLKEFEENNAVLRIVDAITEESDLKNITGTLGVVKGKDSVPLTKYYRKQLDRAVIETTVGAVNYNTVIRETMTDVASHGIRRINYGDRNYYMEAAARQAILSSARKISNLIALQNAKDMDQDLLEITAHSGARPSHEVWQGKVVSRSGRRGYLSFSDIGYGDPGGFAGINCRHDWYPYFEGLSVSAHKDTYKEKKPFEYNGVVYTHYEASQRQRQIERSIRKSKRKVIAFEEAEDLDRLEKELSRITAKYEEYNEFVKVGDLQHNPVYRFVPDYQEARKKYYEMKRKKKK